jgi:Secretion system C-terminal sorting domain
MKQLFTKGAIAIALLLSFKGHSAIPTANFSITSPVCTGATYTIQDLSTNLPTSWSYTIQPGGFGPPQQPTITTVQNPTVGFQVQGTYTITLISTNSSGSSVPVTQTITVLAGPNANINPATSNNCPGGAAVTISVTTGGGPFGGGTNTYNWSNGATTNSISVSPSVTTVYFCIITGTNGCSITRDHTVTISNPTVTIVSTPASICPGTACTLQVTITGGGPKTYAWSNASTTTTITTTVTGVYTATGTNGQGCSAVQSYSLGTSTTLSLTATANPSVLCSGNTGNIQIAGASNYTWSNGSSLPTFTVNPTTNTTYTVTGQIGTCTGTTALTLSVSVLPTITIVSNPLILCSGASATLNANGASAYTWTPTNTNLSSIVVSPSLTTTYTVRGQNLGCAARNSTISITVSPSPILAISSNTNSACAGEAIGLSVSGANTYSWNAIGNTPLIIVYPTSTTTYSVTGTNNSNCSSTANITINISACTAITELTKQNALFTVYPNPSNGMVSLSSLTDLQLEIYNLSGQLIKTVLLNQTNAYMVNLSSLTSGIYFIKSSEGISKKLIIE